MMQIATPFIFKMAAVTVRCLHRAVSFSSLRWLSSNVNSQNNSKSNVKFDEPKEDDPPADPHLPPWPDGINPHTGEMDGPRGPEPTRYGDWERKGRVSDF